ncbi:hypothetical protein GCM10009069_25750 [Algimonas arctica]|uniref:Uncharacterized protein n=1 Tax=Algimonas arctica TaxID=1479486 RepID=A0A8J3CU11_9PROT|nr:hypothetical protein [Algimonas arctica]GHB01826.1 hypothetical protein GCM10009069_25750 [Algimonas arctica]
MIKPAHKTHTQVYIKFALLLALMLGYFIYLTLQYDLLTGGIAALLTWSFFVFCTPIADAGFLLDFPLRLLFGIRMVVSEIAVWTVAVLINAGTMTFASHYYDTTILTKLLQQIITTPYPYWGIILLSGFGTFLSIRFGDELLDVFHHRDRNFFHTHHFKHELILFGFFILIIFGYYYLISTLGIDVSTQA